MATQTVVNQSPLFDLQKDHLSDIFGQAKDIYYDQTPSYYDRSTVAERSRHTQQGQDALVGAAGQQGQLAGQAGAATTYGSAGVVPAVDTLTQFAQGGSPAVNRLAQQAAANVDAAARGAGTLGSARAQLASQQAAGDIIAKNRLQAAQSLGNLSQGFTGQLGQASLLQGAPGETLKGVGAVDEDYEQRLINADIDRYNFHQNLPYNWLNQYTAAINPGITAPTQKITSSQPSGLEGAVGTVGAIGSLLGGLGKIGGFFGL